MEKQNESNLNNNMEIEDNNQEIECNSQQNNITPIEEESENQDPNKKHLLSLKPLLILQT